MGCVSYPITAWVDENSRRTEGRVKGLLKRKPGCAGILQRDSNARQAAKRDCYEWSIPDHHCGGGDMMAIFAER